MALKSVTLFTEKDKSKNCDLWTKSKHFPCSVCLSAQTEAGQTYKHLQGAGSEIHLNWKFLSILSLFYYVITDDSKGGITDRR